MVVREVFVATFSAVTVTAGSTPPLVSVTRPTMSPVPCANAGKQQVACGRDDAGVGDVIHHEAPLRLAGVRIDREDRAMARRIRPIVDGSAPQIRHARRAGMPRVGASGVGTNGARLPPPKPRPPSLYSTGTPPNNIP